MVFGSHYNDCNRIELGFAAQERHEPLTQMMFSVMSDVANMPWNELNFLWHGHTFDFPNIKGFLLFLKLLSYSLYKVSLL